MLKALILNKHFSDRSDARKQMMFSFIRQINHLEGQETRESHRNRAFMTLEMNFNQKIRRAFMHRRARESKTHKRKFGKKQEMKKIDLSLEEKKK